MSNDINNKTGRLMEVLPVKDTIGFSSLELSRLPMYSIVGSGILKPNIGVNNRNDLVVYDVTNTDEAFKQSFAGCIYEITVLEIINEKKKRPSHMPASRITTLLSLLGNFQSLSDKEQHSLGCDFVRIEDTMEGLKVTPVIRSKGPVGDVYLRLDTLKISPDVLNKISGDLVEIVQKPNGLYQLSGMEEEMGKELK